MSMRKRPAYLQEARKPYDSRTAMEEAARCLLCHDAPCSKACPAGTDPAKFIRSLRFRNVKGAAEQIRSSNPLGGICGRVCPQESLCEEACSRCGIDRPIEIGSLQSFAADQEALFRMKVMAAPGQTQAKAACIGAGPASLSCAAVLAQQGVEVTVYEKMKKAGGLLTYGIIPSRLPLEVVSQEIEHIEELGVKFVFCTTVGRDISLAELREQGYRAVFVGTGLGKSKTLDIDGADLEGVEGALEFLARAKTSGGNMDVGKDVIVIGGGDVAMDAAATARLLGAKVTVVYRRTLEEAPAHADEIEFVQSLGVGFALQFTPEEIQGDGRRVTAVKAQGKDGVSQITLKADRVIVAIGQEDSGILEIPGEEWVFSAGDVVNGGKTVVQAVADGKAAAEKMLQYLGGAK